MPRESSPYLKVWALESKNIYMRSCVNKQSNGKYWKVLESTDGHSQLLLPLMSPAPLWAPACPSVKGKGLIFLS